MASDVYKLIVAPYKKPLKHVFRHDRDDTGKLDSVMSPIAKSWHYMRTLLSKPMHKAHHHDHHECHAMS